MTSSANFCASAGHGSVESGFTLKLTEFSASVVVPFSLSIKSS